MNSMEVIYSMIVKERDVVSALNFTPAEKTLVDITKNVRVADDWAHHVIYHYKWIVTQKSVIAINKFNPAVKVMAKCTEEDENIFNKEFGVLLCLMKLSKIFNSTDISILGTYKNCLRFMKKFYTNIEQLIKDIFNKSTLYYSESHK